MSSHKQNRFETLPKSGLLTPNCSINWATEADQWVIYIYPYNYILYFSDGANRFMYVVWDSPEELLKFNINEAFFWEELICGDFESGFTLSTTRGHQNCQVHQEVDMESGLFATEWRSRTIRRSASDPTCKQVLYACECEHRMWTLGTTGWLII